MRNFLRIVSIYLLIILASAVARPAFANVKEYKVKAAFIVNFLQLIDWPKGSLGNSFDLCLIKPHSFGKVLRDLPKIDIANTPLTIREYAYIPSKKQCDAIFIGKKAYRYNKNGLSPFKYEPVLTLGESEQFLEDGGVISFALDEQRRGKVGFLLNLKAANDAKLKISSDLIQLAKYVKDK